MIIDNEQQREVLLALFDQATVSGSALDLVYEVKQAVRSAKCYEVKGDGTDIRDSGERQGSGHDAGRD